MNDDLISRAKLLAALDHARTHGIGVREAVKSVPAEVAEVVRHARWVNESYIGEGEAHFNCSKCGAGETHRLDVPVPYCWKCGAKMDQQEGAPNV